MSKCLFLDRDGVINKDEGYVYRIEDFEFNSNIFKIMDLAKQRGYLIIVVTNQSGIERGYYDEIDFKNISEYMQDTIEVTLGFRLDDIYHCPHGVKDECNCRKPMPGMINKAIAKYNIDASKSLIIGDKSSDMEAGSRAGLGRRVYLPGRFAYNYLLEDEIALAMKKSLPTHRLKSDDEYLKKVHVRCEDGTILRDVEIAPSLYHVYEDFLMTL